MAVEYAIRPARFEDAQAIAGVHVEAWRATYAGLLPGEYLSGLSVRERARNRRTALADQEGVRQTFVIEARQTGTPKGKGGKAATVRVVGFGDCGPARGGPTRSTGEFYAIYLASDVQNIGLGRALMAVMARHLLRYGVQDAVVWALGGNRQAHWFYERLGGMACGERPLAIAGQSYNEVAYCWDDLTVLASAVDA